MKAVLVFGLVVIGGAGIGLALERSGFASPIAEPAVAAALHEVPYHGCPGEDAVGSFHGGDRVYITGMGADGAWLEVRAPFEVGVRVWVEAQYVTEDSALDGVPEAECEQILAAASETPITGSPAQSTTTSSSTSSSTTTPGSTSTRTTLAPPTTGTSQVPPTTGTSQAPPPPDTEGPIINFFQADESDVWEDAVPCAAQPRTMQVGGVVSDTSGVQSVWISWDVGSARGTRIAVEISENVYFATIGPFAYGTISGGNASIWLEIKAYDDTPGQNKTTVSSSALTVLHECGIG